MAVMVEPTSPATATLLQARPRMPEPSRASTCVHPVGPVTAVPLVEFVVRNSRSVSPAATVVGTLTVWLTRLPDVVAAATNDTVGATACAGEASTTVSAGASSIASASMEPERRRRRARADTTADVVKV